MPEKTKSASLEARREAVAGAIRERMEPAGPDSYMIDIIATFEDSAIFRNYDTAKYYTIEYTIDDDLNVTLGEATEVEQTYVAKSLKEAGMEDALEPEITGPIVYKNKAKQIAYAAVLVPGEIDSDGESVTKEQTERAAHEWMEYYQNLDLQHTLNNVGVPVESYLTPQAMTVKAIDGEEMDLPEGTWILGSRLNDDTWEAVEKNELTGYSVMGMRRAATKSADAALKKTLLRDLGPDWVATYVSVVDRPAVPKAKFFALKSQGPEPDRKEEPEPTGTIDKIKLALGMSAGKEGRKFAKGTLTKLKAAAEALQEIMDEADAEEIARGGGKSEEGSTDMEKEAIKEMIDEAVGTVADQVTATVTEKLEAFKSELEEKATADAEATAAEKDADQDAADEEVKPNEELEAFKSEVNARLEAIGQAPIGSQALKGQDGSGDSGASKADTGRDIFGRRTKK